MRVEPLNAGGVQAAAPGPRRGQPFLDRTHVLSVVSRALPVALGPATVYLIGTRLTPELQGYYFTFASLAALQMFVELGLSNVLVSIVSHEWAHLTLRPDGAVTGTPQALARLASLGRSAFLWYAAAGILLVAALVLVGGTFLSTGAAPRAAWQGPWIALCVATGLQVAIVPYLAILEGCNQVKTVYVIRSTQAVVSAVALWLALAAGAKLWALPLSVGAGTAATTVLLGLSRRRFWALFRTPAGPAAIRWQEDVLPLQWRMALQGIVYYFAFQLFNPVVFHYHGAIAAGQMGMTLSLLNAVSRIGYSIFEPAVPTFGVLIARRDFEELDRRYARTVALSIALVSLGVIAVVAGVAVLDLLESPFRQRLLDLRSTALLAAATVLLNLSQCRSGYIRAHKRDPQVFLTVSSSLLIGALVWLLGRSWGALGAAVAYAVVQAFYITPLQTAIFRRWRREFRAEGAPAHPPAATATIR